MSNGDGGQDGGGADKKTPRRRPRRIRYEDLPVAPELLRDRAKEHIRRHEWEQALANLDVTLQEPEELPRGVDEFVPNKQSLIIRGRIQLILNNKRAALDDALAALRGLETDDPMYTKVLSLRADALFQMGHFEHALVFYYRGNRLKEGGDDVFRLGIQKAKESINNCLKCVRPKMKVDVFIQNTELMLDRQTVSQMSFVFPREVLQPRLLHQTRKMSVASSSDQRSSLRSKKSSVVSLASMLDLSEYRPRSSSNKRAKERKFCSATSKPFSKDIAEMKKIVGQLRGEGGRLCGKRAERMASSVLSYVKERNDLWKERDSNQQDRLRRAPACDFDSENLPYLDVSPDKR